MKLFLLENECGSRFIVMADNLEKAIQEYTKKQWITPYVVESKIVKHKEYDDTILQVLDLKDIRQNQIE